jgi:hypothetical protein
MKAIRLTILAALAVLAMGALASCGSDDEDGTTEGTTTDAPAQTSEAPSSGAPSAPAGASAQTCDTYAVDAESLRVTGGVSCGEGRKTMLGWQRAESCRTGEDASRGACSVRGYRCLGVRVDRGVAVSCARSGRSITFIAKR